MILTAAGCVGSAVAIDPNPRSETTSNPARAGDGEQVGVATLDGVTVSGGEAFVTRNGTTEKLVKDLRLPSGVTVQPDGTMIFADKSKTKATLKSTQLLTLDGKIVELPPNPTENPGDPRGNGTETRVAPPATPSGVTSGAATGSGGANSGRLTRNEGGGSGTVFLGNNGVPFMGTINPNGTVVLPDGTIRNIDGSFRAVTFGFGGTPMLGTLNANGTITRTDGATVALDGSVRAADGTIISPATSNNAGLSTPGNTSVNGDNTTTTNTQQGAGGTQQGGATQQGVGGTQQIDPGTGQPVTNPGSARNTNSPNNSGTLNRTNVTPNATGSPANAGTGTVNNGAAPGAASQKSSGTNATNTDGTTNTNGAGTTGAAASGNANSRSGSGANSGGGRSSGSSGGARAGGAGSKSSGGVTGR